VEDRAMNVVSFPARPKGEAKFRFKCALCDDIHEGLPDITYEMPDVCFALGVRKRAERMLLTSDFCVLDGAQYYLRCVMEAPVSNLSQKFGWGVWCRVEWRLFKLGWDRFNENDNSDVAPFRGILANRLACYPDTDGLPCRIALQDGGLRPLVTVTQGDHPLTVHQQQGMTLEEAITHARKIGVLLIAS
jgi:hypothetical protein